MKAVLQKYHQQMIGINLEKPFRIEAAILTQVEANFFSVRDPDKGYTRHFPYNNIIQIIEHPGGVEVGGLFSHKEKHKVVVKVGHIMEVVPT